MDLKTSINFCICGLSPLNHDALYFDVEVYYLLKFYLDFCIGINVIGL
jgi:hypothetical protein